MAQQSWPYAAYNSGAVTDAEYEALAARFSGDGVYGTPADTAVVAAGAGLSVDVRAEVYASVRGHGWHSGTTAVNLPISTNASGSTRVDRVVLRLDRSTWTVAATVREGTAGAGAPALVQDDGDYTSGVYEIPLATVTVPNGAASVTVTRAEQYVGTRTRPCTSTTHPLNPAPGEQAFETDTGTLRLWTGSAWVILYEDSGEITLGAGESSWASISGAASVARQVNGIVHIRLARKRLTSLPVTDVDGSKVATVSAALAPPRLESYSCQLSGGHAARIEVRTTGDIYVLSVSETVPAGNILYASLSYPRR